MRGLAVLLIATAGCGSSTAQDVSTPDAASSCGDASTEFRGLLVDTARGCHASEATVLGCRRAGPTTLDQGCILERSTGRLFLISGEPPTDPNLAACTVEQRELVLRTTTCP